MIRFHLSLNVADLGRSVAFYRALFGIEPAKLRSDYAKFEPNDPPLVLSLEPTPRPIGGPLNHLGFRLPDVASLIAMQARLEAAGLQSQREEGVECCYAKQTKFWLHDPDGTLWEVYTLEGDIEHRGQGQAEETVMQHAPTRSAAPVVYEHRMGEPIPTSIAFVDGSVDEVRLRGTFNLPLTEHEQRQTFAEVLRVLKPGGRLFVHVLTADHAIDGPNLPGAAAMVRRVPDTTAMVSELEVMGLTGIRLLKFGGKPCFVRNDVEMRETQIEGWKPLRVEGAPIEVIYRGPFEAIETDGVRFRRGQRQTVPAAIAARLRGPEFANQFTLFPAKSCRSSASVSCTA